MNTTDSTPATPSPAAIGTLRHTLENEYRIERPQVEDSTLEKMRRAVKHWEAYTGDVPISKVDRSILLQFRKSLMDADYAPPTTNSVVRSVLVLIHTGGGKPDSNRLKLTESGEPKATPTLDELGRIWKLADSTKWPCIHQCNGRPVWIGVAPALWWRALLMITFSTGLRCSDVFGLRWNNIKSDRIPTRNRKTKKFQYLPIPDAVRPWLDVLRKQDSDTLFTTSGRTQQMNREFGRLCELAECERFGMQAIRRAAARAYEKAHAGAGKLLLNHGKDVTAEFYLDSFETLQQAAQQLTYPPHFLDAPYPEPMAGTTIWPSFIKSDRPQTDANIIPDFSPWDFI